MEKQCKICGNTDERVLVTHHIDKNSKNNSTENLQILCANCHYIEHDKKFNNTWSSPIMLTLRTEGKVIRKVLKNNQTSGKVILPAELVGKKIYVSLK